MVAIFTGAGAGLERGSGATLGAMGLLGGASLGRSGENVFLNAATGNLLINRQDEFLVGRGPDAVFSRTYNSLGNIHDDNGDRWRQSTDRRIYLSGTANAAGSQVSRVSADGSQIVYTWNGSFYATTQGAGAHDKIVFASGTMTWTDGSSQATETYLNVVSPSANEYRIVEQIDTDGNKLTFTYTGTKVTRITTADGNFVEYSWAGNNITQIVTSHTHYSTGTLRTLTRTRYGYDATNRLTTVTVDLSPEDGSISDNRTYVTTYTYDGASGQVASISQSDGSKVEFGYSLITELDSTSKWRVTSVKQWVDAVISRTTMIGYDVANQVTTLTDATDVQTKLSYDANGQLLQVQQAAPASGAGQPVTKFDYNASGDVIRIRRYTDIGQVAAGNAVSDESYTHDANGNVIEATDALGNVTKRTYGAKNELLTETRSLPGSVAATTRYVYDAENHLRYVISSEGRVTEYRYTATGLLDQTIEYPEHVYNVAAGGGGGSGIIASASFEAPDLGNGYQYSPTVPGMTFSAMAGITSNNTAWGFAAAPEGDQVAFIQSYGWGAGQITQQLSGLTAGTVYTVKFRLAARPATGGTRISVTVSGNTLGSIVPSSTSFTEHSMSFTAIGSTAVLVFDGAATHELDMATAIDDVRVYGPAAAPTSEAELNAWRNAIADRSSAKITVNSYDARGNLASVTSYGAATTAGAASTDQGFSRTTFVYDQAGRLLSRFNDGQNSETFVYDGLGRVTSSTDLNGGTTSIVFNDAANRTVLTLANGFVETSTYNRAGELINRIDSGHITAQTVITTVASTSYETPEVGSGSVQNPFVNATTNFFGISGIAGNGSSWGFAPAPDGDQVAYIQTSPGGVGTISQTITGLAAGAQYQVKFSIGASGAQGAAPISVSFNGTSLGTFTPSSTAFQEFSVAFTAGGNQGTLTFSGLLTSASRATAIDKVSVSLMSGGAIYGYDQRGLLRTSTDGTGFKTYFIYDRLGRKVADVNHLGDLVEYVYDTLGRLTGTARYSNRLTATQLATLANAQVDADLASFRPAAADTDLWTWQIYDKKDRLVEAIEGDGSVTIYEYDSADRLVKTIAYANKLSTAQLDGFKTAAPSAPVVPAADSARDSVARNFYDKDDLLVGVLDGEGFFTRIVYDKAGQKVEETAYLTASWEVYRATGTFEQLSASQGVSAGDRRMRYVYDGQGLLRYQINGLNQLVKFNYNAAGQLTGTVSYPGSIPESTDFTFDNIVAVNAALGQPSHPDTRRTWTVYDGAGRVAYEIDAAGGVVRHIYDTVGQVTKTIRYAAARATTALPALWEMDGWAAGQTANAANRTTRHYYTAAGELRFTVDAEGFVSGSEYDAEGRVTRTVRWATALSATDSDTTQTIGNRVTGAFIDGQMVYDPAGRLVETIDGEGFRHRLDYNANGTLASETAAYGHSDASRTAYVYDRAGRAIEKYVAHGTAEQALTRYAYDGLGNVVSLTDPNGNVTTRSYDRAGRMVGETNADNGVVSFQYNAFDEVVKATDHRGNASYNYYDKIGRLIAVRDNEDYVTELTYTGFGELASKTRRANRTTSGVSVTFAPTVTASAQDSVTRFYYDRVSRLVVTRDAENYLTETGYNMFGEATSVTRRANRTTSPADPATPPTVTASDQDAVTRFDYDRLGRVVRITDAENYFEQYGLDAFGRRTGLRNKLGATTSYAYDKRGLLLSETLPVASVKADGTIQASAVTNKFEYDGRGNRTKMIEAFGLLEQRTTTYSYDKANRVKTVTGDTIKVLSTGDYKTLIDATPVEHFKYDAAGNLIERVDPLGAKTLYWYDSLNRLVSQIDAVGALSTFAYDRNGNLETTTLYATPVAIPANAGGTRPVPPAGEFRQTVSAYDKINRLASTTVKNVRKGGLNPAGAYETSLADLKTIYDYNANGGVEKVTDASGVAAYTVYDRLGRTVRQIDHENYETSFALDAEGNVLTERRYANRASGVGAAAVSTASAADRVTTFTYDRNGRRRTESRAGVEAYSVNSTSGELTGTVATATIAYEYNGLGQVTFKTEATGDFVSYTYDAGGRLVTEARSGYTDHNGNAVEPTMQYWYDGLNQLTRTRQGNAVAAQGDRYTTNSYVRGRLASTTGADGVTYSYAYDVAGNLLSETYSRHKADGSSLAEGILYSRDILGRTVSRAVSAFNGSMWVPGNIQSFAYNSFGEVSARGLRGSLSEPLLMQEQFAYDNAGRLWRTNADDGVWRYFVYDANGRETLAIESEGTDLANKTMDQVLAIATANGAHTAGAQYIDGINVTVNVYDKRGLATATYLGQRQLSATDTRAYLGASRSYNAFGEVVWEKDARGFQTDFAYNIMGRMISVQKPLVWVTGENGASQQVRPIEYSFYDLSGRLVGSQDANDNRTTRTLLAGSGYGGSEALVTLEFHPDDGVIRSSYDQFADLRKVQDEELRITEMSYDAKGRLIQSSRAGLIEYFVYDLLGQRIKHWNNLLGASNVETTDYDLQGRVTRQVAFGGDVTTTSYVWSSALVTAGMGTFGGWTQTTTHANGKTMVEKSDMFGRELEKKDYGDHVFTFSYDLAGRMSQQRTGSDTIDYVFLNTGLLGSATATFTSSGRSSVTTYTYDENGNKKSERLTENGAVRQDATADYDALGRLSTWRENGNATAPASTLSYAYDANGNIRSTHATYLQLDAFGNAGTQQSKDHWYRYDSMNRVVTSQGILKGGTIVRGTAGLDPAAGIDIEYDKTGQRVRSTRSEFRQTPWTDAFGNQFVVPHTADIRETYEYDARGFLSNVYVAETQIVNGGPAPLPSGPGTKKASYEHDVLGRLLHQFDYAAPNDTGYERHLAYNAKGQVLTETTYSKQLVSGVWNTFWTETTYKYGGETPNPNEGAIGPYLGVVVKAVNKHTKNGALSHFSITDTSYDWWDGAVQKQIFHQGDVWVPSNNGTTNFFYNGWGQLDRLSISDGRSRSVTFVNNLAGEALRRDEADFQGGGDPHEVWYRFDGRQVGYVGNNGTLDISYQKSIESRMRYTGGSTGAFRQGDSNSTAHADFDQNFSPINSYNQGSASGSYTVRGGETLATIAAGLWGDASLWYKLAEANGMTGSNGLVEGQTLRLPAGILKNHNNASTFKPYDPAETLGDVSPTTPMPQKATTGKKNKCGIFGQIVLIAVAVAVTVVTAGAAVAALSPAISGLSAGVSAIATGTTGLSAGALIGIGAASSALGSIVSQAVGAATGLQSGFDWKAVALAGISGGVGGGLGKAAAIFGRIGKFNRFAAAAAQGAAASTITQGIGVATRLQAKFSWAAVAAAGAGAAAAGIASERLGVLNPGSQGNNTLSNYGRLAVAESAGAIASAAVRSLIDGSDFGDNVLGGLADVIGSTLGNMIGHGVSLRDAPAAAPAAPQPVSPGETSALSTGVLLDPVEVAALGGAVFDQSDTVTISGQTIQVCAGNMRCIPISEFHLEPEDSPFFQAYVNTALNLNTGDHEKIVRDMYRQRNQAIKDVPYRPRDPLMINARDGGMIFLDFGSTSPPPVEDYGPPEVVDAIKPVPGLFQPQITPEIRQFLLETAGSGAQPSRDRDYSLHFGSHPWGMFGDWRHAVIGRTDDLRNPKRYKPSFGEFKLESRLKWPDGIPQDLNGIPYNREMMFKEVVNKGLHVKDISPVKIIQGTDGPYLEQAERFPAREAGYTYDGHTRWAPGRVRVGPKTGFALNGAGKLLTAYGAYQDYNSFMTQLEISRQTGDYSNTTQEGARIVGGWGGAYTFGKAGAVWGGMIGGPWGAVGGGLVGSVGGYFGGSELMREASRPNPGARYLTRPRVNRDGSHSSIHGFPKIVW